MVTTEGGSGDSLEWLWLAAGIGEFSVGDKQVLGEGESSLWAREGSFNTPVFPQAHEWTAKADTVVWGRVGSAKIKMGLNRREKNALNTQPSYDLGAAVGRIAMSSLF